MCTAKGSGGGPGGHDCCQLPVSQFIDLPAANELCDVRN